MRKISEIFYSLQDEGFHTETSAIFIRFSGRNSKCSFCDTCHEEGVMMTDEEIVERISSFPAWIVILTEGELSLWIDKALISCLRETGGQICTETNGARPSPDGIDWVVRSPKENVPVVLERTDKIETVYIGQDLPAYAGILARYRFLRPYPCQNTKEAVDYIPRHPRWRLSLQTHKLIDIQ